MVGFRAQNHFSGAKRHFQGLGSKHSSHQSDSALETARFEDKARSRAERLGHTGRAPPPSPCLSLPSRTRKISTVSKLRQLLTVIWVRSFRANHAQVSQACSMPDSQDRASCLPAAFPTEADTAPLASIAITASAAPQQSPDKLRIQNLQSGWCSTPPTRARTHSQAEQAETAPSLTPLNPSPCLSAPQPPLYLVGLISAFLQPNVSQPVELLQGHEVDAALNPPLIDLRRLCGRRETCEAGGTTLPTQPLGCRHSPQVHHKAGSAATINVSGALREPPAARPTGHRWK